MNLPRSKSPLHSTKCTNMPYTSLPLTYHRPNERTKAPVPYYNPSHHIHAPINVGEVEVGVAGFAGGQVGGGVGGELGEGGVVDLG